MSILVTLIVIFVRWMIVPLILLSLLVFGERIGRAPALHSDKRLSARAGFWAGLVFTVIYVIASLGSIAPAGLGLGAMPGFRLLPLLLGLAAGFILLWGVWIALPTRFLGLVTLALSTSSSVALFSYVFIGAMHGWVMYWTLGAALGMLLFTVFFPSAIRQILL